MDDLIWHQAPVTAMWCAWDKEGRFMWFFKKPRLLIDDTHDGHGKTYDGWVIDDFIFDNRFDHLLDCNWYESLRPRVMRKPSWVKAPKWAGWLVNQKHTWYWHANEPTLTETGFVTNGAYKFADIGYHADWANSKEKRPDV